VSLDTAPYINSDNYAVTPCSFVVDTDVAEVKTEVVWTSETSVWYHNTALNQLDKKVTIFSEPEHTSLCS
jgi:hypothetical protein